MGLVFQVSYCPFPCWPGEPSFPMSLVLKPLLLPQSYGGGREEGKWVPMKSQKGLLWPDPIWQGALESIICDTGP